MKQIDRKTIHKLIEDKNITNMGVMTYISALRISKYDENISMPVIENFNQYRLFKIMNSEMDFINEVSVRNGFDLLVKNGYLVEDTYINAAGIRSTRLLFLEDGTGHITSDEEFKNDGYINIPNFLFEKVFFDLSLRAKKLVLEVLSRLGNGTSKEVKINFKSKKNKNTFISYCKKLKVNRLQHIKDAIKEIEDIFNIKEFLNNTFVFAFNDFSESTLKDNPNLFDVTDEELSRTKRMIQEKNTEQFKFTKEQVKEISKAIRGYTMKVSREVLEELCIRPRNGVKNFYGYVKAIMTRLSKEGAFS